MCMDCGVKYRRFARPEDRKLMWCTKCARDHPGAICTTNATMCHTCGVKQPTWGMPEDKKRRWCGTCRKAYPEAIQLSLPKKCDGCGERCRIYGLPGKPKRWCAICAKSHTGAVKAEYKKMCEDCRVKVCSCGLPGDKKRWCTTCGKNHPGVHQAFKRPLCEDCDKVQATYGQMLQSGEWENRKPRWCAKCAKGHEGSACLAEAKLCQGCGTRPPTYGLISERGQHNRKRRWCDVCAKFQSGTELFKGHAKKQKLAAEAAAVAVAAAGIEPQATATAVECPLAADALEFVRELSRRSEPRSVETLRQVCSMSSLMPDHTISILISALQEHARIAIHFHPDSRDTQGGLSMAEMCMATGVVPSRLDPARHHVAVPDNVAEPLPQPEPVPVRQGSTRFVLPSSLARTGSMMQTVVALAGGRADCGVGDAPGDQTRSVPSSSRESMSSAPNAKLW
jgi:hypothetical protein